MDKTERYSTIDKIIEISGDNTPDFRAKLIKTNSKRLSKKLDSLIENSRQNICNGKVHKISEDNKEVITNILNNKQDGNCVELDDGPMYSTKEKVAMLILFAIIIYSLI